MRTITAREAEQDIDKLLVNVRREPVTVTAAGVGSAVVMSADAYARMRGDAVAALLATLEETRCLSRPY
jgi:prevent-host-death family protein